MTKKKKKQVNVRPWQPADIPGVVACHQAAYPAYADGGDGGYYRPRTFEMQQAAFPEGQVLAEIEGQVIGYATSLIVQLEDDQLYTYDEITGSGAFSNHIPGGDTLYGADIAVHPDFRGRGVAKALYKARKKLLKRYNLRRMVAYGRIPGYHQYGGAITAQEYVDLVTEGRLKDLALNAHLKAGYQVKRVMLDFVIDTPSLNYCTWLEMPNPDYKPEKRKIAAMPLRHPVRKIRVCAAQYLMRPVRDWGDLERAVTFFVETADTYHCHFLLMPEFFTAQLLTTMPAEWDSKTALRELAAQTERYIDLLKSLAVQRHLYIIGGSQPVIREEKLYNVAHLFTPTGHIYTQDKLHITPAERSAWDIHPGQGCHVFETPLGRIAIQVSYDIEFPEMTRLLAMSGAEVIFVPFSTDEKKAYHRVRIAAQTRAVENSIYVAIAGTVGNLPNRAYLLNYGQSAIFTPSDFAFPNQATAGEAEPNVETVVIADLDLTSLAQHRELGSTRPLYDRRLDLYELRAKAPVKVVRTE